MSEYTRPRPEGAIDMADFVQLMAESWNKSISFYRASPKWGVETIKLDRANLYFIKDKYSSHVARMCRPRRMHHGGQFSLKDANLIENNYNDWFPFADERLATQYSLTGDQEVFAPNE